MSGRGRARGGRGTSGGRGAWGRGWGQQGASTGRGQHSPAGGSPGYGRGGNTSPAAGQQGASTGRGQHSPAGGSPGYGRGGNTSPAAGQQGASTGRGQHSPAGGSPGYGRGGNTSPAAGQQGASTGRGQHSPAGGSPGYGRGGNTSPAAAAPPPDPSPVAWSSAGNLGRDLEQKQTAQASSWSQPAASSWSQLLVSSSSQPPASPSSQPLASSSRLQPASPSSQPLASSSSLPSASSKALRHAPRPGFGTLGSGMKVKANHFLVTVADRELNQYDVTITPEITSKKVSREVMKELVKLYGESDLGIDRLAYDGRKSCYTARQFPFTSKDFVVKLERSGREFKVTIKFASKANLYHLNQFLLGQQLDVPQETLQFLDVVLRDKLSNDVLYEAVGRSFFSRLQNDKGDLGNGVEYWKGFYQSLRPTQMGLSLNINISARGFFKAIKVTDFAAEFLNKNLTEALSDQDRIKLKKALRNVKVETNHRGFLKQNRITGFSTDPIENLMFNYDENGGTISVAEYFRRKYKEPIDYPFLQAVQTGSDARPVYLPMEICTIAEGQRYTKKLNEGQVIALLKANCQRPSERENGVFQRVRRNGYNGDELVSNVFGMTVGTDLTVVEARVLPPPKLIYHDSRGVVTTVDPRVGQWNMIDKKMVDGGKVKSWACINFSREQFDVNRFLRELIWICRSKGMEFNPLPIRPFHSADPRRIEDELTEFDRATGKSLELLFVILPDARGSYGEIKRVCETKLGLISQCCQASQAKKFNRKYMENVALKINVKVGGRNTVLADVVNGGMPFFTGVPTIIFGADVTHPQPGDYSSPSIAAVVASIDWPEVTKYKGLVSTQTRRQEIIQDLYNLKQDPQMVPTDTGMIRELLTAYYNSTKLKPKRIIFYRDGVSEGQFQQVLHYEVDAITKACSSLDVEYKPTITFIIVQKRHNTRFFPVIQKNHQTTDNSGNILPGTVVDSNICHRTEFDFYLCSHAGIQGTSRPAHYHVLHDENGFTADNLQSLTNSLCYTYARCTRSVSIVPPAYYAHLAAFRARYYIEGNVVSDNGSGTEGEQNREVVALPKINDRVKEVMFYC
ncbi:protein argonaute 5-like [Andrographis paniculata]|uniref:protein argonaute 5-like n=1 Tax=Andrographis paniculata TaxID=175694 RepID=UPI0021E8A9B3|nr:protein argonaute 5-like [Andrographis paniculata]